MNMQNLMAQAQKMQKDITKKKEEIDASEFTGKSEWVEITMYGNKKIKSIKISNKESMDKDDIEALEDMLKIAFNDACNQIENEINNKLGMYSQMNGLF
jgi:nucleoid-associated protein EbfC